jgi:hypothetical protein
VPAARAASGGDKTTASAIIPARVLKCR